MNLVKFYNKTPKREYGQILPLICRTNSLLNFKIDSSIVVSSFQLIKVDRLSGAILQTIVLNTNLIVNGIFQNATLTGIEEGYYYYKINNSLFSDTFLAIYEPEISLTKFLIPDDSLIKFYENGREISTEQQNEVIVKDAIRVSYKQLAPFKFTTLASLNIGLITEFRLLRYVQTDGLINGFQIAESKQIPINQILNRIKTTRKEYYYNEVLFSDWFMDIGLYQIYIRTSNNYEVYSELISPVFPNCDEWNRTFPTDAILSSIAGNQMNITYKSPNEYTTIYFQVLKNGVWKFIGEPIKYSTGNKTVSLPYLPEYQYIRYFNFLNSCIIGYSDAFEIGVNETFFILTESGAVLSTESGEDFILNSKI